jgi:hypothetical protein
MNGRFMIQTLGAAAVVAGVVAATDAIGVKVGKAAEARRSVDIGVA